MIINVSGVLVQQVLHLVAAVEHQHQRDDGELAAGTRRQVALAAAGIRLDGSNKLFHVAGLNGFARQRISLVGIVVRRIVREVAADDEEVFVGEIGLQHLSHALQLLVVVGGNDNRNDGRHIAQSPLQERQLHLQAVFLCMGGFLIAEQAVGLGEL